MVEKRKYDAMVARIAGNILSGWPFSLMKDTPSGEIHAGIVRAVYIARAIVAEVERTESASADPFAGLRARLEDHARHIRSELDDKDDPPESLHEAYLSDLELVLRDAAAALDPARERK